jgi:hypothetical protein
MIEDAILQWIYQGVMLIVPFVSGLLVAYLLSVLTSRYITAKAKNPDIFDVIEKQARRAVQAAEQLGIDEILMREYEDKKDFAIAFIQRELNLRGFEEFDVEYLADAVETAVFSEINKWVVGEDPALPESEVPESLVSPAEKL